MGTSETTVNHGPELMIRWTVVVDAGSLLKLVSRNHLLVL